MDAQEVQEAVYRLRHAKSLCAQIRIESELNEVTPAEIKKLISDYRIQPATRPGIKPVLHPRMDYSVPFQMWKDGYLDSEMLRQPGFCSPPSKAGAGSII